MQSYKNTIATAPFVFWCIGYMPTSLMLLILLFGI